MNYLKYCFLYIAFSVFILTNTHSTMQLHYCEFSFFISHIYFDFHHRPVKGKCVILLIPRLIYFSIINSPMSERSTFNLILLGGGFQKRHLVNYRVTLSWVLHVLSSKFTPIVLIFHLSTIIEFGIIEILSLNKCHIHTLI